MKQYRWDQENFEMQNLGEEISTTSKQSRYVREKSFAYFCNASILASWAEIHKFVILCLPLRLQTSPHFLQHGRIGVIVVECHTSWSFISALAAVQRIFYVSNALSSFQSGKETGNFIKISPPTYLKASGRLREHQLEGYVTSIFSPAVVGPALLSNATTSNDHSIPASSWGAIVSISHRQ